MDEMEADKKAIEKRFAKREHELEMRCEQAQVAAMMANAGTNREQERALKELRFKCQELEAREAQGAERVRELEHEEAEG